MFYFTSLQTPHRHLRESKGKTLHPMAAVLFLPTYSVHDFGSLFVLSEHRACLMATAKHLLATSH